MALRNQPYLPLYVQDFMTDEKLNECSPAANGIYIRLMCILHKSETYGQILLKQKYKQNESKKINLLKQNCKQIYFFAYQLEKNMPFSVEEIASGLEELIRENVIQIEEDVLFQKRMVKDGILSDKRSSAGSKGGKKRICLSKNEGICLSKTSSKTQANSENEIEYENEIEIENINSNNLENEEKEISKKIDPYCSEEKSIFIKTYEQVFNQKPYLTNEDCWNLAELVSTTPDFFNTLTENLKKTKKLDFKTIGYKPDAGWFLKSKNYAALRNGVYDGQIAEETNNDGFNY